MTELVCIVCPKGCRLQVDKNLAVTGNACPRGEIYAKSEITNPTRMVTSTVKISGGVQNRLPVKTDKPIDKNKVFDILQRLNAIKIKSPVKVGDIIIENIFNTNVNIVATNDM